MVRHYADIIVSLKKDLGKAGYNVNPHPPRSKPDHLDSNRASRMYLAIERAGRKKIREDELLSYLINTYQFDWFKKKNKAHRGLGVKNRKALTTTPARHTEQTDTFDLDKHIKSILPDIQTLLLLTHPVRIVLKPRRPCRFILHPSMKPV